MFERYTESARRALFLARYAVSRRGAAEIEPEHLLLGLLPRVTCESTVVEQTTTASLLLQSAGVERRTVERRMQQKSPPLPTSVEIPFSASAKHCLVNAGRKADQMEARSITTGHLLLALLQADGTDAHAILHDAGLRLHEVRLRVEADRAAGVEGALRPNPPNCERTDG